MIAPLSSVQLLAAEDGRPICSGGTSTLAVTEDEALFLFLVRRMSKGEQDAVLAWMDALACRHANRVRAVS